MLNLSALAKAVGLGKAQAIASSYKQIFDGPDGEAVLSDLALYCYVSETTAGESDRQMLLAEGRRQAFMRIADFVELDWREWDKLQRDVMP